VRALVDNSHNDRDRSVLLDAVVRVPQHVVYRDFPTETVVLNLQSEQYHGLNPTAGNMLAALDRAGSVRGAAVAVAEHFGKEPSDVESDICRLCDLLMERGVIEVVAPLPS
jgi:hypothetical protein